MLPMEEQIKILTKGVEEIINVEDLKEKLSLGKSLNIKLGLDPSAPDIHLGHTVVLRKLKQFQDLGHHVIIIIGDFTGMIGDPTGKSKTRKQLTQEEVMHNAKTYEKQLFRVLDREKTEVRFNSEWLSKLHFSEVIELASKYSVSRMLERDDFKKRFMSHQSIGIHEFFYPLIQGYDSLAIHADVEIGGTDQRFNILMGRTLQKVYGKITQAAIFMPILEGIDGKNKMSKSLDNYIGIDELPNAIYGKTMSIPDQCIIRYYQLVTDIHPNKIADIKEQLDIGKVNPRDIKMALAKEIVRLYYGETQASQAEQNFIEIFQKKKLPDHLRELTVCSNQMDLISIIKKAGFASSNSEARRLVQQGAVSINNKKIDSLDTIRINHGAILKVGKRRFVKLVIK